MSIVDTITELATEIVDPFGLCLYDVELNGGTLRVTVEGADGVDLERLAEITRLISRALDAEDPMPGRYTLEVSSPGLERRLRTPAHYRGAIGETVNIKLAPGFDGNRRVRGQIGDVFDDALELLGDDGLMHRIEFGDITRAVTVFEWGPTPRPGKGKGQSRHNADSDRATDAATEPERRANAR